MAKGAVPHSILKGDDCYGAKKYVDWVKKYSTQEPTLIENIS
jgi:hypothetical protein